MKIKFVHTNIIAKDWEKLAQFYTNTFGFDSRLCEGPGREYHRDPKLEIESEPLCIAEGKPGVRANVSLYDRQPGSGEL
jgi:hypothetical protein